MGLGLHGRSCAFSLAGLLVAHVASARQTATTRAVQRQSAVWALTDAPQHQGSPALGAVCTKRWMGRM